MPIYEYQAKDPAKSCAHCVERFEVLQRISDPPFPICPKCGTAVRKVYSTPSVGASQSGADDKAKSLGFSKFKKLGKGEYERQY